MPGFYHQPIRRRDFLRTSVLAGAAAVLPGCQVSRSASGAEEIHLALLSDTHIGADRERAKDPRGYDPWENLHRVVPDIVARSPRGIILNGDAASREGLAADYRELKTLLEPVGRVAPVYLGLGNHDNRETFREVFRPTAGRDAEVPNHHVLIVEESFIRFIVLDSLLYVNKSAGLLGGDQRAWLTEYLNTHTGKPVILATYLNADVEKPRGGKSVAILAVTEKGQPSRAVGMALANQVKTHSIQIIPALFTPRFVSDGLFAQTFSDPSTILKKLELASIVDVLLFARLNVSYVKTPSLENVITANMELEVSAFPTDSVLAGASWTFTANGPGFTEPAARALAEKRLIKQIAGNNKLTLASVLNE